MSDLILPRDCPARFATPRTLSRKTMGTAAGRIATVLGTPLMPWQSQVLDVALEIENGQFVFKEVIITVPRQSGKTTMMLCLILARAMGLSDQRIVYTAQTRSDARKKWFEEWIPAIEQSPFSEHTKTRLANGDEALIFPDTRSRQGLVASTAKAGHGQTLDLGIVDEAFAQPDARLEQSLKPAMVTRNQPPHHGSQMWIVSTAGTLLSSPYLLGKVEAGREIAASGHNRQVAYFEWSAPDDSDPASHETWASCMPALGRTASVDAVQADFLSMDLHEFMRAYLNMWTTISVDPAIPLELWKSLAIKPVDTSGIPIMLSADVTPDRNYASISASGRLPDGKMFVEVVKHNAGVQWVVPALKAIVKANDVRALVVDPFGPVNSLLEELEQEVHVNIRKVTANELARSCAMLYDACTDYKSVTHFGQQDMAIALDGATKRPIGDGGWAFGRKTSGVDISPLVAATLAHWFAVTEGTGGAQAWSLDEVVEELRERKRLEALERGEVVAEPVNPYRIEQVTPVPDWDPVIGTGAVTFVPL